MERQTPLTPIVVRTEDEGNIVARTGQITQIVARIQMDVGDTAVTTALTPPIAKLPTFPVLSQANPPTLQLHNSLQAVQ
jgi:hypothetical protein